MTVVKGPSESRAEPWTTSGCQTGTEAEKDPWKGNRTWLLTGKEKLLGCLLQFISLGNKIGKACCRFHLKDNKKDVAEGPQQS